MTTAPPQVRVRMLMGLPFSLHLPALPAAAADAVADTLWARLAHHEQVFSTYRPDSDISRLNRGEVELADCDPAVAEILDIARTAYHCTAGVFDVRHSGHLDPAGIVKGWAAENAYRAAGVELGYLNAGGDLVLSGPPRSWRIGIEHPADPSGLLTAVELGTAGIATSGRAHRGDHLIDPTTRTAAHPTWQATVIGPSLPWADILATTAAITGPHRLDRRRWPDGHHVLLADTDGSAWATDDFDQLIPADLPALHLAGRL